MYFYGYRQHQPHAFVNKLNYLLIYVSTYLQFTQTNHQLVIDNFMILNIAYPDTVSIMLLNLRFLLIKKIIIYII